MISATAPIRPGRTRGCRSEPSSVEEAMVVRGAVVGVLAVIGVAVLGCAEDGSPAGREPVTRAGAGAVTQDDSEGGPQAPGMPEGGNSQGAPGNPGGQQQGRVAKGLPVDLGEYQFSFQNTAQSVAEVLAGRVAVGCRAQGLPADCVQVRVDVDPAAVEPECPNPSGEETPYPAGTVLLSSASGVNGIDRPFPSGGVGPKATAVPGETVTVYGVPCRAAVTTAGPTTDTGPSTPESTPPESTPPESTPPRATTTEPIEPGPIEPGPTEPANRRPEGTPAATEPGHG
ncbi:hypothetical protein IU463_12865 [Nocardia farcinica]|uniref:hypothetical protein n=1 Tax=Nocardia farcinica TaxID=37329 RepID=UPI00189517E2|nr:hypothetical protein [Nocardia farcinica]MBF6262787.1 hypothetical protein [Nocardia farcinica]MBF6512460.1 hypothetical protein [Nocardia farcinica]